MKVFFNAFWPEFLNIESEELTYIFFIELFKEAGVQLELTTNPENADVLIESHYFLNSLLKNKEWKLTVFFNQEPLSIDNEAEYDIVLGKNRNLQNSVPCPLFVLYNRFYPLKKSKFLNIHYVPKKTIAGVVSQPREGSFRSKFFNKLLSANIGLDMGGEYMNTIGYRIKGPYWGNELQKFYSNYMFGLAFENHRDEYYITEKIINIIKSGAIPIYYGSLKIADYFNTDRIIVVTENNQDTIIKRIQWLIENPDEWLEMARLPYEGPKFATAYKDIVKDLQEHLKAKNVPLK